MSPLLTLLVQQPAESDEVTRNSFLSTAAILVGILVGLGTLAGIIKRMGENWVKNLVREQQETRKRLTTKNGKTVGEYSEESFQKVTELIKKQDESHKISLSALTLAEHNSDRLDKHMEGHVPKEKP